MMGIPYKDVLASESEETQAWVKHRAAEMEQELNLRELRRLRKLTQARLSRKLKIGQEGVSRIEKRSDLYLSTLRDYIEGVGGKLSLVVEFPDQPPIRLAGLGGPAAESHTSAKKKSGRALKSRSKTRRAA